MEGVVFGDEWEDFICDVQEIFRVSAEVGIELSALGRGGPDDRPFAEGGLVLVNGVGELGHESLVIRRDCAGMRVSDAVAPFEACKTSRKPYTATVQAVLIALKRILPKSVLIGSDGDWDVEWNGADIHSPMGGRELFERTFADVGEVGDAFRHPLEDRLESGDWVYLRKGMGLEFDWGVRFLELPFGADFWFLVRQAGIRREPLCFICGESDGGLRVRMIDLERGTHREMPESTRVLPICAYCHEERLFDTARHNLSMRGMSVFNRDCAVVLERYADAADLGENGRRESRRIASSHHPYEIADIPSWR